MKRVRYTKYVPDPAGEMSMEDLLSALSDYLLQSGFQDYMFYELPEGEKTLEELRQAIERALLEGDLLLLCGSRLFPLMKVYRRLTAGEEEDLRSFYNMVTERLGRPAQVN